MDKIIGDSDHTTEIKKFIYLSSSNDHSVLLEGESGTGKDLIATLIHNESGRANRNFVYLNCGSLPDTLIESELFGYLKGSFTGALVDRRGLIEQANNGTLYLDEIESMNLKFQATLLHVLERKQITKIGATEPTFIDIRVIAASNENIKQLIAKGSFRKDLYYRLNVLNFSIKSLRERKEDIYPIADYYLKKLTSTTDSDPKKFSSAAIKVLENHSWYGNVREIINLIKRLAVYITADVIEDSQVKQFIDTEYINSDSNLTDRLTITELAKVLGISRKTLWEKKKKLIENSW
ncbi:MAG: sigma-54-dependent Fis family transcriptional regulator [Planctomycetes bacterium]|nr:sigma-54-dependent Fis family transcriptional regulator [Planctomycetota bacterium]